MAVPAVFAQGRRRRESFFPEASRRTLESDPEPHDYLVIDVGQMRAWAWPFVWVGANPLAIYLASNIVDFGKLSERFAGGDVAAALNGIWPGSGGLVLALVGAGLCFGICGFLYQRKIFLRI